MISGFRCDETHLDADTSSPAVKDEFSEVLNLTASSSHLDVAQSDVMSTMHQNSNKIDDFESRIVILERALGAQDQLLEVLHGNDARHSGYLLHSLSALFYHHTTESQTILRR